MEFSYWDYLAEATQSSMGHQYVDLSPLIMFKNVLNVSEKPACCDYITGFINCHSKLLVQQADSDIIII